MAKILLAEDDEQIAQTIERWLHAEKYLLEVTGDGADAYNRVRINHYDLVILDWSLPGNTGIEICRSMRSRGDATPVLMLTGKSKIDEIEHGFDQGADDYLTKPFHLKELAARVKALLRRPRVLSRSLLRVGDLELDVESGTVTRSGAVVELMPKEFAMLELFMRNPRQIFSLEALQSRLWSSESEASTDSVRVQVCNLRRKIDQKGERSLFRVVHRKGYMLDVAACDENS